MCGRYTWGMATTVIAVSALVLSVLPMLYWVWRRYLRRPTFRVRTGRAFCQPDGEEPLIVKAIELGLTAIGGGQARVVVDAMLWLKTPHGGWTAAPRPDELRGNQMIQVEADTPTKFELHFGSMTITPGYTPSGQLECRLVFDMGTETSTWGFIFVPRGDGFMAEQQSASLFRMLPGSRWTLLRRRARSLLRLLGRLLGR